MKKLLIIIATTIMATTAWAQSQLLSVKGKTKDGKSINVQYYKGTAQDYIESVKYQLVDELKADNKNKQNNINELQTQLNKANKRIDQLNDQLKKSGNSNQSTALQEQLDQKQGEIDQLNQQNNALKTELSEAKAENERLKRQLDSIKAVNLQLSQNKKRPAKNPIIGVEASMGSVFMVNNLKNENWEKSLSWNKEAAVYFGTDRLLESFPLSVEAGIGFRSLPLAAKVDKYSVSDNYQPDCVGDSYRPDYVLDNCTEKLTVNCLEVPVRLCLGQPNSDKVSVYMKLGVSPAYILSANLANGPYTRKGYYPKWNVTFEEIEELDFFNNAGASDKEMTPKSSKFNLWGNFVFGTYVPLNSSILFNFGAKVDYPFIKTDSFVNLKESSSQTQLLPDKYRAGLDSYSGGTLTTSLQLGLIYSLNK